MRISWQKVLLTFGVIKCKNTILINPVKRVSNLNHKKSNVIIKQNHSDENGTE
jgi:hypothetical protein